MKKIIAALDGLKYSGNTAAYAISLTKETGSHLVGVFLDDFTYHSYKSYELVRGNQISQEKQRRLDEKDAVARAKSVKDFEKACQKEGLHFSIHHDRSIALPELLHESIYADLLVIDSHETFTHYVENSPTHFISDLLQSVQSPVILVPGKYKPIEKIVLLFDGEPSSMHAIKMFCYNLPLLKELPAEVVTVKNPVQTSHMPDNKLMKEFMKRHFNNVSYKVIKGDAEEEIVKYLKSDTTNALVVLGAYRRGMVSRWFRPSMADLLMKEVSLPLFIAHIK
jgi:hypothetical protein